MSEVGRWVRGGAFALGMAGALSCSGDEAVPDAPPAPTRSHSDGVVLAAEDALRRTADGGRPTVLVVTSTAEASSQRLWENLATLASKSGETGWSLARLTTEDEPLQVRRLGVRQFPTVLLYRKGENGLELAGFRTEPSDAAEVLEWLGGVGLLQAHRITTPRTDSGLMRTGWFHHANEPSPQSPPATSAAAPPPAPAPAPAVMPAASVAAIPAQAPVVVSTSAPPIVLQQTPPTVYVAPPSQPANIVVLSPPPAAPSVSVVSPNVVASAAPSLFLASPSALPASVPMPLAAVPAATAAPAAATTVAAIPPSLLGRLLGAIGERFIKYKYPRIMTTTTTTTTAVAPAGLAAVPAGQPAGASATVATPAAAAPSGQR